MMRTFSVHTVSLLVAFLSTVCVGQARAPATTIGEDEFLSLMRTVSDGWNEGNARKAADCFAENAVYIEPPNRQVYIGRSPIYDFFGGPTKPSPPMHMQWHHLAFNKKEQVGFGEFTFQMNHQYHGIVTVQIERGKIAKWREYQYRSDLEWDHFAGRSRF